MLDAVEREIDRCARNGSDSLGHHLSPVSLSAELAGGRNTVELPPPCGLEQEQSPF
jgi:hypothetical protein